jgi:uncharacterized protein (TIGR02466 family)
MSLHRFFPTQLWVSQAPKSLSTRLNRLITKEARQLEAWDDTGTRWCRKNYPGGYTSYASVTDLPQRSSTFSELRSWINREVARFSRSLELDLLQGRLEMTTCWVNIMRENCTHPFHLHPLSTISGTYYVEAPRGAGCLKIEDPRIASFMTSPPRAARARLENQRFHEFQPQPGQLILFESWLKHEVPQNRSKKERISVSFNYDWIR